MNRKRLTILALFIVAVFAFSALVACVGKHVHNYDKLEHNDRNHWYVCAEDGERDDSTVKPHSYDSEGKCTVCGYSQSNHEHVYGTEYKKNANQHWLECTVQGCGNRKDQANHEYPTEGANINTCTVCGNVRQGVHVHTMEPVDVQPATCSETGLEAHYICTAAICNGKYFVDENGTEVTKDYLTIEIDPDNHKVEAVAAKEPTCTIDGNFAHYECEWCHTHYKDEAGATVIEDEEFEADYVKQHIGHEYNFADDATTWETPAVKEPECVTEGLEQRTCIREGCTAAEEGHVDTRAIPATNHPNGFTHVDEQAPTCEEDGWVEHYTCELCKMNFEDADGENEATNIALNATGHELTRSREVIATCTAPGTKEYWYCTNEGCGMKFTDQVGNTQIDDDELVLPIDNNAHPYDDSAYEHDTTYHWYNVTCEHKAYRMFNQSHFMSHGVACLVCGYMKVEETTDYFTYEDITDDAVLGTGVVITGLVDGKKDEENLKLVFPSEIDGKKVVAIADRAFADNTNIISVVINGIPKIGESAFDSCVNLSELTLLEGVRWAYRRSFYNCKKIEGVVFPLSMDGVGVEAFFGTAVKWIVIDDYYNWGGFPGGEKQYIYDGADEAKIQQNAFPYTVGRTVFSRGVIKWEGKQFFSSETALGSANWVMEGNWGFYTDVGEPYEY